MVLEGDLVATNSFKTCFGFEACPPLPRPPGNLCGRTKVHGRIQIRLCHQNLVAPHSNRSEQRKMKLQQWELYWQCLVHLVVALRLTVMVMTVPQVAVSSPKAPRRNQKRLRLLPTLFH